MAAKVIGPSGVTGPSEVIDPTRVPTIILTNEHGIKLLSKYLWLQPD